MQKLIKYNYKWKYRFWVLQGDVFMFKIGDWVVYGGKGVCKVMDVGKLESICVARDRLYYTLEPCSSHDSRIFTPVDNEKVVLRPAMNEQEAMELIDSIHNVDTLWISDEKSRENNYKEALRSCECTQLVKMIKTIYFRKKSRMEMGKKMTASDEKYFRIAEDQLYNELAVALNMDKEKVKKFIEERVTQKENS